MRHKRLAKDVHKQSLGDQIDNPESHGVRVYPHKKARRKERAEKEDGDLGAGQSAAILALAREQQQEEDVEAAGATLGTGTGALASAVHRAAADAPADSDDSDGDWDIGERELEGVEDFYVDDVDAFTPADEQIFNAFMQRAGGGDVGGAGGSGRGTLADIIMAKLKDAGNRTGMEEEGQEGTPGARPTGPAQMDATLEQVYTDIGKLLRRYTTGKLPKAFKIVPNLRNWEEVIFTMDPEHWSPHATYAATKMFVSQLNAKQTQRFLNLVLLHKVRDDIRAHRRLHFALFQAVKKAVFKPGAFYKGFVLPLLKAGDCTLREAVIISSVLTRVSIPVDHSAAALLRMADMPYSGVTSFFIKTLLDKKYALPYRVVDALVDHFTSFANEARTLPVIWHLCLLTFVQRYKAEIRAEDKDALRALMKAQSHHGVTPEIQRELVHGRSRGEAAAPRQEGHMTAGVAIGGHAAEDVFNMAPVAVDEAMEF